MDPCASLRRFQLLLICLLFVPGHAQHLAAQTSLNNNAVTEALKGAFGTSVSAVAAFTPYYLAGDFNGDGAEDVLIVVRLAARRSELPPAVKLLNPFYRTGGSAYPADPATQPTLALAIIHGSKAGWQSAPAVARLLLVGESPVLILENTRALSSQPADLNDLMELIRKRPGRRGARRPPAAAKGDAILLGTEAAESFLYWNGTSYVWKESDAGD
jgi:hypothetical protein